MARIRPDANTGIVPLQHTRATVIKLHGDYLDVDAMGNTPAELAGLPSQRQRRILGQRLNSCLDAMGLMRWEWDRSGSPVPCQNPV